MKGLKIDKAYKHTIRSHAAKNGNVPQIPQRKPVWSRNAGSLGKKSLYMSLQLTPFFTLFEVPETLRLSLTFMVLIKAFWFAPESKC